MKGIDPNKRNRDSLITKIAIPTLLAGTFAGLSAVAYALLPEQRIIDNIYGPNDNYITIMEENGRNIVNYQLKGNKIINASSCVNKIRAGKNACKDDQATFSPIQVANFQINDLLEKDISANAKGRICKNLEDLIPIVGNQKVSYKGKPCNLKVVYNNHCYN